MDKLNSFLIDNFGFVGVVIIVLAIVVASLAGYIFKLHRDMRNDYKSDKENWHEERKEFRESLDKNTDALKGVSSVIDSVKILLETLVRK